MKKKMALIVRAQGQRMEQGPGQKGWPLNSVFTIVIYSLLLKMQYTSRILHLSLLKSIILTSIQP